MDGGQAFGQASVTLPISAMAREVVLVSADGHTDRCQKDAVRITA